MLFFIRSILIAVLCFAATPAFATAPTVKSFAPIQGPIGTSVTIIGTTFTGATSVRVGGVAAAFRVVSATQIVATLPASGSGRFVIATPGGSATSTAVFTVTPGALAAPIQTHPGANITVTASGMDPYSSMDVFFDTTDVALAVSNASGIAKLTIGVPANATPIKHWITFDQRSNHKAVQTSLTINTDWLEGDYSFNLSAYNPYEGTLDSATVPNLKPLWVKPNGGYSNQEPMVEASGTLFVSDVFGNISAYSATGSLVWKAAAGGFMSANNPIIYGSNVYFANASKVFAYSMTCGKAGATCKPIWTAAVSSSSGGLTQYGGMLYIGGTDGNIHPINPATGKLGTPFSIGGTGDGAITTPIAFNIDGAYAYGTSDTLHVNYGTGGSGTASNNDFVGAIAFNGNLGYYESGDGVLHELRGRSWTATLTGTNCVSTPVVAYGMVFAGDCSYVWGFNAATGAALWTFSGGSVTGVSVANHIVYACASSTIVAVNADNGAYLWAGGFCSGAPLVANGMVYSNSSDLYAFTIPSLAPNIVHNAPLVAGLRRDMRLVAIRTPEISDFNR